MYEVLVVDDSPVYRELVEQALSCERYSLTFARDGAEALRLFEERSPSFVITDLILPDFSGIELCQRIRSDASRPYTYVIFMTGKTRGGGSLPRRTGIQRPLAQGPTGCFTRRSTPGETA